MSAASSPDLTAILLEIQQGDDRAADRLVPLVYDELRQIARRHLRRESPGHTLSSTALVHEAYLKLIDQSRAQWINRAQFFAVASRLMRRILVDHARKVLAGKRGGGWHRLELESAEIPIEEQAQGLVALDEALEKLSLLNPRLTQVVEHRYFGGMTEEETAQVLGLTARTVRRDWVKAKGWLHQALGG